MIPASDREADDMTMRCFVSAVLVGVSVSGAAEVLTDDPAVVTAAGTYAEPFIGTGENSIVFKGSGTKIFTSSKGVQDFASVKVEDGQVWGQANGVTILHDGDISLETAALMMDYPKSASSGNWKMYSATNGTIRFGADSIIGIWNRHSMPSSGTSTLKLGRLARADAGGTLFVSICNYAFSTGYPQYGYSNFGNASKIFVEGFSDGETLPACMIGGSWGGGSGNVSTVNTPASFLKYTDASGIMPADTVSGFDVAGENDIVKLTSATTIDEDSHVKGVSVEGAYTLTVPEGKKLTVGNGTDPAGMLFYYGYNGTSPVVAGDGEIAFGSSQGIIWVAKTTTMPNLTFGNVAITGERGVIFASRHFGTGNHLRFNLTAANWKWSGPAWFDGAYFNFTDSSLTAIDNDIYIRGNSLYGATFYHGTTAGTYNLNGHVHFTGPGSNTSSDAPPSFYFHRVYNGNKQVNFNGAVTIKHKVVFKGYNNRRKNSQYKRIYFNGPIDGDGQIHFLKGEQDVYFRGTNAYAGATVVDDYHLLHVTQYGTLGFGDVQVNGANAYLNFENKSGYAMGNAFSGTGNMKLVGSSLVFSNDVSIGTLTFDANSSAAFGGAVSASTRLTFPAGAEMSALDGASPTLTVTNGTVFAGNLSNIDIVCDGVVTNRGTLAVAHIGANKRLDPIVIDGDAVFENATFEISGIADAMGGTHTVLSVTGAVEGEPTFSFPEGKVYAVTRTGNDWSIEKKAGLVLFVR